MKICQITSAHKPDDIRIYHKQCKSLAKFNHEVTLLCSTDKDFESTSVKFVKVEKPKNRSERVTLTLDMMYRKALEIDADIYHAHDPELLYVLKKLKKKGKKVIFDFHEDISEQIKSKHYINKYLRHTISYIYTIFENKIIKDLDGIIAATPYIQEKYNGEINCIENVNNYPLLEEFKKYDFKTNVREDKVLYIGGLTKSRGLFTMLKIAKERPEYNFVFCGDFTNEADKEKAFSQATKNCTFKGFISRKEISNELVTSKVGLVLLESLDRYKVALPIKMFEYMASGTPVIASNFDLWENIINKSECGFSVSPKDTNAILDVLDKLMENHTLNRKLGKNGRKAVENNYNWKIEEKKLIKFYKEMENI